MIEKHLICTVMSRICDLVVDRLSFYDVTPISSGSAHNAGREALSW
jgi:hypothetical protein